MFALQGGQARQGGLDAQQLRIAGVNAGHEGVGQCLGHLAADATADEGVDGLVAAVPPRRTKTLGQEQEPAAPAEDVTGQKRRQAIRQQTQPAVEEEIAVAPRRVAGGEELRSQPQFAAQVEGERLVVEEAVGTDFDAETVVVLGANGAAQLGAFLQNDGLHGRRVLFEPIGEGQPGNASTDDDDSHRV